MELALFGKGKMGKIVEKVATARQHTITPINKALICIDFSHPDAAIKNLFEAANQQKSVVMGTTGWYDRMDEARQIVEDSKIGFLWAANFSLGVWLYTKLVREAGKLLQRHYDVSIVETHHREKVDRPSGTAKTLGDVLVQTCETKNRIVADPQGAVPHDAIHISSVRSGSNAGNHTVIFDAPTDTITLSQQSHNREGYALGAVIAAEWLQGRKGFFTLDDLMEDLK